jgi:hypothetical protein
MQNSVVRNKFKNLLLNSSILSNKKEFWMRSMLLVEYNTRLMKDNFMSESAE